MGGHRITEGAVILIRNFIEDNISGALDTIQADRADSIVTIENPVKYFISPRSHGYQTPAIFVIGKRTDFRKKEKQANFIDALTRVNVSALIEDKDTESLEYKAWRYQSALHLLLDQAVLTSSDNKLKLIVVVTASDPSPPFTNGESTSDAVWRKEILLECEVELYEGP